jgi:L-aspartate oxidase
MITTDFLVIGSGIAGLNFALKASEFGEVIVVTKKEIAESNTNYAQGGIAAVLDKADSFEEHIKDTLIAGHYHNDKKAVEIMVKEGPDLVRELASLGVDFDFELTKEGGHSQRRIAFSGDTTGAEIEKILVKKVRENKKINVLEHTFVADLIKENDEVLGAFIFDSTKNLKENIFAKATILATGGAGQIYYPHTTNPEISTGDGLAMGCLVGCETKDMEFFQFHPTALFKKGLPTFLLSESLRGEGALLRNVNGELFMSKYDKRKELAPRDIVARAIVREEKKGPVYLDMRHFDMDLFKNHFKNIYKTLTDYGIDPQQELIPISPAAHYTIGGLKVDMHGATGIKKLYAFGEVACTGVHGANRLGSNSLLEALVFSNRITSKLENLKKENIKTINYEFDEGICDLSSLRRIRDMITNLMWKYVGIERNTEELKTVLKKIEELSQEISAYKCLNRLYFETRNIIIVSQLVVSAAIKRTSSLGVHVIS